MLTCITAITLFLALAIPVRLAAQEQQRQGGEGATGRDAGTQNPVPFVNQPLVPNAVAPGGKRFKLTVNGTGFVSSSVVNWNGGPRHTTFVSSSRLKATVLASDIATASTASVTVVNPSPGGGTSNPVFFQVTTPTSAISLNLSDYGTGSVPYSVVTADFNKDEKLDLAAANINSDTVSVLLGNGDGTFQAHVDYATGSGADAVAVGDLNGDGRLDLIVANNYSGTVSILLGNGDGTFQPQVTYATGSEPDSVAVGDFNRDGRLDLAVANYHNSGTVSILLGNGDGTFQPQVTYATRSQPTSVAVGDFNGDGKLDVVTANYYSGTVSILLGNGDGTFQAHVDYATGSAAEAVAIGDFNGDGKLDVVTANYNNSGTVSILLGNGDGTFQAHVDYATGSGADAVAIGDLNGDGKLDLAVTTMANSSNYVSVLFGNGDGTFQAHVDYAAGTQPESVAVGDFNGDGSLDLAVADYGGSGVSVLLQSTTVSLSESQLTFGDQLIGTSSAPQDVTLTNTGYLTLKIAAISITGMNATDFNQTDTCGSSVLPGANCTISVTFKPTKPGPRTASVTITDNGLGSPQSIALSGTGVSSGPNATLSPTSLTFATQVVGSTSAGQPVMLINHGNRTLRINRIVITGQDRGDFAQTNNCGSSVPPNGFCTITVTFDPTAINTRTARLSVFDNAHGSPQIASLTGTGTTVFLHPASLYFGIVLDGHSKTLTTMLTNVGSTMLSITSITLSGEPYFSQSNNCGSGVGGGQSCTISVTFRPPLMGHYVGSVSIFDNGGGSPQTVPLLGY
jgi:hypothetical protein